MLRRRRTAALLAAAALALPLAAAVPASASAAHQARPANAGTFYIQDDSSDPQVNGDQIHMDGHNTITYINPPAGAVCAKVTISGIWYELQCKGECLDAAPTGDPQGNVDVYEESCIGSTAEQWTNLSDRFIENRHYGGVGNFPYMSDSCCGPDSGDVGMSGGSEATPWRYPDAATAGPAHLTSVIRHVARALAPPPCAAGYSPWYANGETSLGLDPEGIGNQVAVTGNGGCWHAPSSGYGTFTDNSGNCLDYYGGVVIMFTCNGAQAEKWMPAPWSDGTTFQNEYAYNNTLANQLLAAESLQSGSGVHLSGQVGAPVSTWVR